MMATPIEDAAVRGGRNPTNPGGLRVTEPLADLPDNICFTLTEMGELLNLLSWLKELLTAAENPEGTMRVSNFIRLTQRRLWGDIQDFVEGPDEPEEG
jgi:hypothetical protein